MENQNTMTTYMLSSCRIKARLCFSVIGIIVGLSAGAVFSVHFKNYNAGIWGLCSAMAAFVAFGVTVAYMRGMWHANPYRLKWFMLSGCFVQLFGVCGFVAYLVLAISQHQELDAYGQGYYIACVWCFMTWKWGFLLLIYARSYLRSFEIRDGIMNTIVERNEPNHYKTLEHSHS